MIILTFLRTFLDVLDEAAELHRECLRRYPYLMLDS
jgi:hypothetical protein